MPDCERDAHAGWVRGVGAIRGGRPRTRGAHVKRGAHGPSVYCVGSFYSPLQKLAASPACRGGARGAAGPPRAAGGSAAVSGRSLGPHAVAWVLAEGRRPHARVPTPRGPHPGAPSATEPWPPAGAPRRVGERGRGAQQPLLGPRAGDGPRLGQFCRVRPAPHAVACPAPHPHGRRAELRARARRGRRQPGGRGTGARAPSRPAHAARRRQPPLPPAHLALCRLGKKVGPNPNLVAFQAQRGRPLGSGVRARRAGWRRGAGHEPARAAPHDHRPPGPRSRQPCARAPPPVAHAGAAARAPRAPGTQGGARARHGLGRDREHAPGGSFPSTLTHPSAPRARGTPNPYSPSPDPNQEPAARRAAPAACAERAGRGAGHGPARAAPPGQRPPGPRGPRGGRGSGLGRGPSADRGAPPT